jgi:hypothetical protein
VQNTVSMKDVGSASASVAFFRTIGGAAGVAALGAVLGNSTAARTAEGLRTAGLPSNYPGAPGGSLDPAGLPAPVGDIIRAAFAESTALIFLITAGIAALALLSVLFIRETPLRRTVDVQPPAAASPAAADPSARHADTTQDTGASAPDAEPSDGRGTLVPSGPRSKPVG